MSHLESSLRQLVLLTATLSMTALPSFATGSDTIIASNSASTVSFERAAGDNHKQKHKVVAKKHKQAIEETFTNRFSVPFLPAINQ